MKSHLIYAIAGERTFVLAFDAGDEAATGLLEFARQERVSAAELTGIGAFKGVTVGHFDLRTKDYFKIVIAEQIEVLSLVGNICLEDEKPKVHAHVVVGKRDGTAHGGHLLRGYVMPTLEVIVVESPAHLRRRFRPEFGIALLSVPEEVTQRS